MDQYYIELTKRIVVKIEAESCDEAALLASFASDAFDWDRSEAIVKPVLNPDPALISGWKP